MQKNSDEQRSSIFDTDVWNIHVRIRAADWLIDWIL